MLAFGFRQLIGLFLWGEQSDYPCCTFLIQSVSQQQMGSIEDTNDEANILEPWVLLLLCYVQRSRQMEPTALCLQANLIVALSPIFLDWRCSW